MKCSTRTCYAVDLFAFGYYPGGIGLVDVFLKIDDHIIYLIELQKGQINFGVWRLSSV